MSNKVYKLVLHRPATYRARETGPFEKSVVDYGPMPKRYGRILRVRPEHEAEYIRYHVSVWPEILQQIAASNIRNYSIFLRDHTLFAYFEYVGEDFASDMAKMAADPKTQEWWAIMEPMQEPFPDRKPGEWWSEMEEVFHTD